VTNETISVDARHGLPKTIGRYEITGRLGKGAMGVVYSARDTMMDRTVAIKVMMADLEDDPETSTRFYREARSAGQLVHRNVVTIFDMGQENGRPYIVMEYLEGETLNKYLARPEAAHLEVKVDLMIQICHGLHAAHTRGIFHRDVKPGNLLVRPSGDLKIVDFGIARLASSSMTASGLIMGTPDYMSPEQARGDEIDQRSDIFSMGAVFYYMLTGRKPFAASGLPAVLLKVQTEDPLPIRESEAPAALRRIVVKALSKNPSDRYQTCDRLAADLDQFAHALERQTQAAFEEAAGRLAAVEPLAARWRALVATLDVRPVPADVGADGQALAERRAALEQPLRGAAVGDMLAAVVALETRAAAEVASWQRAAAALAEGGRAVTAGRTDDAIAQLEAALRIEPASARASAEQDRCRNAAAQLRAFSDRATALIDEGRKAAAANQWHVVVGFCDDALEIDPEAHDAVVLKERAQRALQEEAKQRHSEATRALERAEVHRRKGDFGEAARAIATARETDPSVAHDAAEARLKASIDEVQLSAERSRQAAEIIDAARARFGLGQHAEAIELLREFAAATPAVAVTAEISRMEMEAQRLAAAARRAAEVSRLVAEAQSALAAGNPQGALDLGTRALALEPNHQHARKVSGDAGAILKERAEAQSRAAEASRLLEDAKQHLARGKFQKARDLVSTAAGLVPTDPAHKVLLARIQDEETRAAAEAERQRVARQRAKAVAPILERARAAAARGEHETAAWMAENALALDLECAEAKEIFQRAKASIAANPRLADETVDMPDEPSRAADPDDTASLLPAAGLWQRLTEVFRPWRSRSGGARKPPGNVGAPHRGIKGRTT
jgi:serine/threonine-protein kinase